MFVKDEVRLCWYLATGCDHTVCPIENYMHCVCLCFEGIYKPVFFVTLKHSTVVRRLTTGIQTEKYVVRRFHCVNVIQCTYANLDSIAYYTPSLYGIVYCS